MLSCKGDAGAGDCPNPKISLTPDDINQIMRPEECVALGGNCCNWACSSCNDGVGGIYVISISILTLNNWSFIFMTQLGRIRMK